MPAVLRFRVALPCSAPDGPTAEAVAAALGRLRRLRCIERVAALIFNSGPEIPINSKEELARLQELTVQARSAGGGCGWLSALRLWSLVYGAHYAKGACEELQKAVAAGGGAEEALRAVAGRVLFRVTAQRHQKGHRQIKPAWKSPDAEREVGEAVCRVTGWRASMLLNTTEVLVVLVADRAACGLVLQPPNPVRLVQDFHAKSRDERAGESLRERNAAAAARLSEQTAATQRAEGLRERLLAGGSEAEAVDGDREGLRGLRPMLTKDEVRLAMSENSMSVAVARGILNLAGLRPGEVVCDPFMGCGTLLVEACLKDPHCACVGGDLQWGEVGAAAVNADSWELLARGCGLCPDPAPPAGGDCKRRRLAPPEAGAGVHLDPHRRHAGVHSVCRWDATALPLRSGCVDVVVSDFPFGNRCGTQGKVQQRKMRKGELHTGVLKESLRVLRPGGRCVFLAMKRQEVDDVLRQQGAQWRQLREPFRVDMNGINPWVYALAKS
eukprot:TRINITY_DN51236_c0_g1_i1.p1 TRINITY_DN51236_c0_g1~~TRINITY_DN51236_c0_g1_i1.p1  ORF type:complete len:527 (+),score=154.29 TRINITY_DN51236_c0_g1_i1:90-1583(+)